MTEKTANQPRPAILCILDGWGTRDQTQDNAIRLADTPVWDGMMAECPHTLVQTSGLAVGLPDGQMGNSEVGHMNIGAGRVVMQDLPRIDDAVATGELAKNPVMQAAIDAARTSGGRVHMMGLLSPGGVHSHQDHMAAMANILADAGLSVAVHAWLDGRDTPPKSADGFLETFQAALPEAASVATICGRFWAMDRDKRWDRVSTAYDALVDAKVTGRFDSAREALADAYTKDETDEFVQPRAIGDYQGMADGDVLLIANFRADRAREILTALVDPVFDGFRRDRLVKFATHIGMVNYSDALDPFMQTLFPSESLPNTIGEVVAAAGMRQLRIAETEKYAHVTFFLNGGQEAQFDGEERVLIQSPDVATYDLQPEMSAPELTDRLVQEITSGTRDLIIVNYANPDMVGHTGVLPAAIKAVETVDTCLGRLKSAVEQAGGVMLVTADHGNIETMVDDETGAPHTAHTSNLVPLVMVNGRAGEALQPGRLCDLAPTMLKFLDLPQPAEMTGVSLLADAAAVAGQQGEDRLHA